MLPKLVVTKYPPPALAVKAFAFKTIIKPETYLGDFGTVILGIIWGIIIFNLDRFIVSSTGKGDGTDSISWKEFIQAFPRIIIAIVLGFAISAPLEIRILQTEIDAKLKTKQDEFLIEMNKNTHVYTFVFLLIYSTNYIISVYYKIIVYNFIKTI